MEFRALLRKSNLAVGFVQDIRKLGVRLRSASTGRAVKQYCLSHSIRQLHLGAGSFTHKNWLGTDLVPKAAGILPMDASKPFPIESQTFDYIFCEHMIEHLTWRSAQSMLKECHRILRPGGIVRIATPDLSILVNLYLNPKARDAQYYIKWITDNFIDTDKSYRPIFVLNNAFHNWGHQFLYDADCLQSSLSLAGFTDLVRCAPQESRHEQLRGIECHGRNIDNEEINSFETMIFEGTREI